MNPTDAASGPALFCLAMQTISAAQLERETDSIIERVEKGESLLVTVEGRPIAELIPHEEEPRWLTKDEFIDLIANHAANPGLREDLDRIAGDTTDDLGPIR